MRVEKIAAQAFLTEDEAGGIVTGGPGRVGYEPLHRARRGAAELGELRDPRGWQAAFEHLRKIEQQTPAALQRLDAIAAPNGMDGNEIFPRLLQEWCDFGQPAGKGVRARGKLPFREQGNEPEADMVSVKRRGPIPKLPLLELE